MKKFDRVIIMAPVWAGYPAPVFNAIVKGLYRGMAVEVVLVSGSGNSINSKGRVMEMLDHQGVKVVSYKDVKAT